MPHPTKTHWTAEQDSYLMTYRRPPYRFTYKQLARDVGRTPDAVRSRLRTLAVTIQRRPATGLALDKQTLLDELVAHIVSQPDMTRERLDAILRHLTRLRGMPNRYWIDRANRPLREWFRELGAA